MCTYIMGWRTIDTPLDIFAEQLIDPANPKFLQHLCILACCLHPR
ncbi:hypothetical protein C5167_049241 [Papaver somniferum]|uniref:Uncharacterized protein n=1 Tax=Papaver somniferum TaxID=3469 RepID=A0A4Y7KN46_PAPSO|nr:hypothetical protein C5167_049241 [Papaver somniferum]